jgi:hypothetical protein
MDPDIALVIFLGLCLVGAGLFLYFVVLNPFAWTVMLVLGIVFFGLKTCTQATGISGPSESRPRLTPDNLISMMSYSLSTTIGEGHHVENFAANASGSITNNSDREITAMKVWCRAEAMQGSETESGWIPVSLRPGETKSFSGQVSDRFDGITQSGRSLRVPPVRHFCRIAELKEK